MMKNKTKGFTLLELSIYMGLLMIMLSVLTQIFFSILDAKADTQAVASTQQDGKFLISRFNYDIKRADSIATPQNAGEITSFLTLFIDGEQYDYSVIDGNLFLNREGINYKVNGYNTEITQLNFQKIGINSESQTVKVTLEIKSRTAERGDSETEYLQTTIGLRK